MKYEQLKAEIEADIKLLAKKIEAFCVLDNDEYTKSYKDKLREVHDSFERL